MRLVIARCSVDYQGRLSARLPLATRLLLVKADGSVSIHADDRAYKPLNWMSPPCRLVEEPGRWVVTNPRGEMPHDHHRGDPAATSATRWASTQVWRRTAWRPHLQELLAAQPEVLVAGLALIRREYPTDIGPVDLLCRDAEGRAVAVEIKRRGDIDGVEQLARYLERLDRDSRLRPVRGILAAQRIKPQAQVMAAARGIACVEVDYDGLRGAAPDRLTLF